MQVMRKIIIPFSAKRIVSRIAKKHHTEQLQNRRWILEIHKQHGDSGTATATFDDLLLYG